MMDKVEQKMQLILSRIGFAELRNNNNPPTSCLLLSLKSTKLNSKSTKGTFFSVNRCYFYLVIFSTELYTLEMETTFSPVVRVYAANPLPYFTNLHIYMLSDCYHDSFTQWSWLESCYSKRDPLVLKSDNGVITESQALRSM